MRQFYTFVAQAHPDEQGWVILFPDLPGCMTQAETWDEVAANAREAFELWMEAVEESGMAIPSPTTGDDFLDTLEDHLSDDMVSHLTLTHIPPMNSWERRVVTSIKHGTTERRGFGDSITSSLRAALKDELPDT